MQDTVDLHGDFIGVIVGQILDGSQQGLMQDFFLHRG